MHTHHARSYCYTAANPAAASVGSTHRRARKLPPAGASLGFDSRAAVLGRPSARAPTRTRAHPPSSGRPSVLVPTPRPRSAQATASKGVVVDTSTSATAEAGCLERSCCSWVRSPLRCLTPSVASAGRTRGRPTGTVGWGRPGSTPGGIMQHRLTDSHCPPERPPDQSSSLGWVAGLRRTHNYGFIRDQPGRGPRH